MNKVWLRPLIGRYASPQTFFGVKKLFLRGGFSDPTSLKDWYGHRMLARFGLPHLRSRYIKLWFNGVAVGLYLAMHASADRARVHHALCLC